jgi:hypothetical protein
MKSLAGDVSAAQVQTYTRAVAGTLPDRSALTDFTYGDPREALSAASMVLGQLNSYCWNCNSLNCYGRVDNAACNQPGYFTPIVSGLALLDAYGVAGDITVSYINEATGKIKTQSVLSSGAGISFCSFFSRPATYSALSPYASSYPAWNVAMKRAEMSCGDGSRRRGAGLGVDANRSDETVDQGGPPRSWQGPGRSLRPYRRRVPVLPSADVRRQTGVDSAARQVWPVLLDFFLPDAGEMIL